MGGKKSSLNIKAHLYFIHVNLSLDNGQTTKAQEGAGEYGRLPKVYYPTTLKLLLIWISHSIHLVTVSQSHYLQCNIGYVLYKNTVCTV